LIEARLRHYEDQTGDDTPPAYVIPLGNYVIAVRN
jgi:hypothetical protein